uniref:uncharacterized protein LOC104265445 n=1 Tax=Ciona intestinalis TaxID=7719 RepID=UPI00089DB295|nr:uncharacterized protein LOC104265445 [Ciona intestinalis]|eukprot:XP_018672044.1 uncharacterized protein LOC104265445 [Ciona intestinalis]
MQRMNETQSFVYMKNEVMMNDTGIYTLTVKSTVFPAVVFVFGITVVDNTMCDLNSKESNSDAVLVGSCLAVIILTITSVAFHFFLKSRKTTGNIGSFINATSVNYKNNKITTTQPKNENNTPQYLNPANKQQAGDNEVGYIDLNAGEPIPNDDVIVRNYEVVKTDYEEIMQSNKKPKNEINEYDL